MQPFRYYVPTDIRFGTGILNGFIETFNAGKINRPLVVTGKSSARACGAFDTVLRAFPDAAVYDHVTENPTTEICDEAAERCREQGCDLIIAIGGGSPMDVAKVVAGLAKNAGPCAAFFGSGTFKNGALPVIAIPTTAGTGSEVTPYAVLVDSESKTKKSIADRALFPMVALLDPELTLTLPPTYTAYTGLDALSQAMEGYVSRNSTALGDVLALEVCRLVRKWLPEAIANGNNRDARSGMLFAAMLSGCVIAQSGTTMVHGLGYSLTTRCFVPHGLANALLLVPVFQFNARYVPEKVAALAEALGVIAHPDTRSASQAILESLHQLLADCGISPAAKDFGVNPSLLREFAEQVAQEPYRFRNQLGNPSLEDIERIYAAAFEGSGI